MCQSLQGTKYDFLWELKNDNSLKNRDSANLFYRKHTYKQDKDKWVVVQLEPNKLMYFIYCIVMLSYCLLIRKMFLRSHTLYGPSDVLIPHFGLFIIGFMVHSNAEILCTPCVWQNVLLTLALVYVHYMVCAFWF